jgi:uncharacterized membrane protein HdeD (DUF308 family)
MFKYLSTLLFGIGLIGLGILFFGEPERDFAVQFLARYWPAFLILAGIIHVAGYLLDRHPRSPVGGMMLAALGGVSLSANLQAQTSLVLIVGNYWFWILLAFIAARILKQYTHRIEDGIRTKAFSVGAILIMAVITGSGLAANFAVKKGLIDFSSGEEIRLQLSRRETNAEPPGSIPAPTFGNEGD